MRYYKFDNEDELYYYAVDNNKLKEHMYITKGYFEYCQNETNFTFEDGREEITKEEYNLVKFEQIKIIMGGDLR